MKYIALVFLMVVLLAACATEKEIEQKQMNADCFCTQEYNPVCGVDHQTYSNACFAQCAGVVVAHTGECADLME